MEVVRDPPEDRVTIKPEPWSQKVMELETDVMKSSRRERERERETEEKERAHIGYM